MIQEIIPLTRPRTLVAALGPTILGAAFSYYAFGAAQGTGLAIFHTILIFLAVVTAQIVATYGMNIKISNLVSMRGRRSAMRVLSPVVPLHQSSSLP